MASLTAEKYKIGYVTKYLPEVGEKPTQNKTIFKVLWAQSNCYSHAGLNNSEKRRAISYRVTFYKHDHQI